MFTRTVTTFVERLAEDCYRASLALERDPPRFSHPVSDGFSYSPVISGVVSHGQSRTESGAPP